MLKQYTKEENEQFLKEWIKNRSVPAFFVKKTITKKAWSTYYAEQGSYCILHNDFGGMEIGFIVPNEIPADCIKITDRNELKTLDAWRRENNRSPFVFEEESKVKEDPIAEEEINVQELLV
jgi:hypothetical protein